MNYFLLIHEKYLKKYRYRHYTGNYGNEKS